VPLQVFGDSVTLISAMMTIIIIGIIIIIQYAGLDKAADIYHTVGQTALH